MWSTIFIFKIDGDIAKFVQISIHLINQNFFTMHYVSEIKDDFQVVSNFYVIWDILYRFKLYHMLSYDLLFLIIGMIII